MDNRITTDTIIARLGPPHYTAVRFVGVELLYWAVWKLVRRL